MNELREKIANFPENDGTFKIISNFCCVIVSSSMILKNLLQISKTLIVVFEDGFPFVANEGLVEIIHIFESQAFDRFH